MPLNDKLKLAVSFSHMLAPEPTSGESEIQGAHKAATDLAFARKEI